MIIEMFLFLAFVVAAGAILVDVSQRVRTLVLL